MRYFPTSLARPDGPRIVNIILYQGLSDEERRTRVKDDYAVFIESRAGLLAAAAQSICAGQAIELNELFHDSQ